jgi:hypothetical protein
MQKNKEEQLKEALTNTLSTEDIQKKLKEETKNIKETREKEEQETKEVEKKEKEEEQKEDKTTEEVKIPFIKDKEHNEEKESNLLLYLVSTVAALLLILTIYLFTSDNFNTKTVQIQTADTQEPKTNEIKQVVKEELNKVVKEVENEIEKKSEKEEDFKTIDNKQNESKEIIKTVVQKQIVEKEVILEKGNFKKFYNSLKFNTLKCYDFKKANSKPDETCVKQLKPFLDKNKDAIRFEVIPVMSKEDNQLFEGMKKVLSNDNKNYVEKVKEYMLRGLSRERVLEVSWKIKEILGEDIVLTPTNYYVKSKENNKGVLIRAYH